MKFTHNQNKGFTLIELLVVIAIIGLLSSVVLASLNSARGKARDARRLSDMNQVRLALELYKSTYGVYPPGAPDNNQRENSCGTGAATNVLVTKWGSALTNALVTTGKFLPNLPQDPKQSAYASAYPQHCYAYVSAASTNNWHNCVDVQTGAIVPVQNYEYVLYFSLENSPTTGLRPYWNNNNPPPMNRCIMGPQR